MIARIALVSVVALLLVPGSAAAFGITFDSVSGSTFSNASNALGTPLATDHDTSSDPAGFSIFANASTAASDAQAQLAYGALATTGYDAGASTSAVLFHPNGTTSAQASTSSTVLLTVADPTTLLFQFDYEAVRLRPGTDRPTLQNTLRLKTSTSLTPLFNLVFDDVTGSETFTMNLAPGQYEIFAKSFANAAGRAVGIADDAGSGSASFNLSVQVVPEPSTALLLVAGVGMFGLQGRRGVRGFAFRGGREEG